eukprot:1160884-Pelagomonas_calceolata.AAC.6
MDTDRDAPRLNLDADPEKISAWSSTSCVGLEGLSKVPLSPSMGLEGLPGVCSIFYGPGRPLGACIVFRGASLPITKHLLTGCPDSVLALTRFRGVQHGSTPCNSGEH